MSAIIVLDSSDDEPEQVPIKSPIVCLTTPSSSNQNKDPTPEQNGITNENHKRKSIDEIPKEPKRIKPTLISPTVDRKKFEDNSPASSLGKDDKEVTPHENVAENLKDKPPETPESIASSSSKEADPVNHVEENIITPSFAALLDACRTADSSNDMQTLIDKKLLKYYHAVHPDFVTSKGFLKTVNAVAEAIKANPDLVYYQLKTIVEELKVRRKSKTAVMSNEDVASTGNEQRDRQIRLLSRGLLGLTRRIARLEESDVDLGDEDNSAFLQVERLKKHACKLYEKICDLTGESKHAHRAVKKPITFSGTSYPQFNRTLQSFINRTHTFPDFFDVLRCLEHCNAQYGFGLRNDDMKKIAQDAFLKVGKSLQSRRKADLYETAAHFTGTEPDPALVDETLNTKLSENQKFHSKIGTLIDSYAKEQDTVTTERKDDKAEKKNDKAEKKDDKAEQKDDKVEQKGDKVEQKDDKVENKIDSTTTKPSTITTNGTATINDKEPTKMIRTEEVTDLTVSTEESIKLKSPHSVRSHSPKLIKSIAPEAIVISDEEDS